MIEHDRGQDYVLCSPKGYRGNSYEVARYSTYSRVATERKGKKKTKKRRQKKKKPAPARPVFSWSSYFITFKELSSTSKLMLCTCSSIFAHLLRLINQIAFRHLLSTLGRFSIFSLDNKTSTSDVFNSSAFIPRGHFETS